MADSGISKLFAAPIVKTEEEKKKERDLLMLDNNPFKLGPGKKPQDSSFGYSVDWLDKETNVISNHNGRFSLVIDNMGGGIEKHYYYFTTLFSKNSESGFGFSPKQLLKLKDVFDASVSSSFHGQIGSKIGQVQQQISTYLTQIGQLTKTTLPLVREIRMMEERLEYYKGSFSDDANEARQNEVTLKSTWIEVVEGGIQNPNSVYSIATKLGFATLPEIFFGINPSGKTPEEQEKNLHAVIGAMQKDLAFNQKVRDVITKKLVQYYTWKTKTYQEMQHTWKFRIKNLKQHYNVIKLYTSWLKPYLTMLKAMQMESNIKSPYLASAFETSNLQMELLVVIKSDGRWNSCLLVRFNLVTRPELTYVQGGQRQPSHVGVIEISIEPYVANDEEIKWYQEYTDKEVLKRVSGEEIDFNASVNDILESLGEDVDRYLKEAEFGKEEDKKEKQAGPPIDFFEPFRGLFSSAKIFLPEKSKSGKKSRKEIEKDESDKAKAAYFAGFVSWIAYDVFKKLNGMFTPP